MTPREWALERVGEGYIYGAKGQKCSPAFRQQQAQQYPAQADRILGTGEKWDGMPVWDCAQLTRAACKQGGVELCSGATSQWKKTAWERFGPIDQMPADEVCCVFREKNGVMQHTGLYIGDGTVVHAKGTRYGVVHDKVGAYAWTHYAMPNWGGSEDPVGVLWDAVVQAENGLPVKMRAAADKKSAIVMKIDCGDRVEVISEDADWMGVRCCGKCGYMMRQFLKRTDEPVQEASTETESDGTFPLREQVAALEDEIKKLKGRLDKVEQLLGEG